MAYVPPDEDPDVDGPVDFEPDAWELADLARWDGRTRGRFAFARTSFCFCKDRSSGPV